MIVRSPWFALISFYNLGISRYPIQPKLCIFFSFCFICLRRYYISIIYSIKIWNLEDPPVRNAISLSNTQPRRPGNRAFPTYTQQLPIFSTTQVHDDYVDSVRWVGNCVLSKSTKNKVSLWMPDSGRYKVTTIFSFVVCSACGKVWQCATYYLRSASIS